MYTTDNLEPVNKCRHAAILLKRLHVEICDQIDHSDGSCYILYNVIQHTITTCLCSIINSTSILTSDELTSVNHNFQYEIDVTAVMECHLCRAAGNSV